jgi:DNA-3-methyladenine glycosylase II
MINSFSLANFQTLCNELALNDRQIDTVIREHGYPPMWTRPNTFETFVHIILEQQVSLASALSALNKLKERVGEITPANVLSLSDEELKACYFSRQKTGYVRYLAEQLKTKQFDLHGLEELPDDEIRARLITLKGVGNWTIDVYLMFVLQRADIFPVGDLAAVNALKQLKGLPKETPRESLLPIAAKWQPNRTIATMILWHYYLSVMVKKKVQKSLP